VPKDSLLILAKPHRFGVYQGQRCDPRYWRYVTHTHTHTHFTPAAQLEQISAFMIGQRSSGDLEREKTAF